MSFDNYSKSRHSSRVVNLFLFRFGVQALDYYAYTDHEQTIVSEGVAYKPIAIDRSAINVQGTLDKSTFSVSVPRDSEIAELFRLYPPSQVVSLVVKQGHTGDPSAQFLTCWTGRVISQDIKGNTCEVSCESVITSIRRVGLRRHYQFGCPHVLYGELCRANKATATISASVVSISGDRITFADGWCAPHDAAKYLGGLVQWSVDGNPVIRSILRVSDGKTLRLSGIPTGLTTGAAVSVTLGCNRQIGDCEGLHNNILNFGGMPWIPTSNPFGRANIFV